MSEVKAVINAEWLAEQVAGIIYNQGKAKIFNVLESQFHPGPWGYKQLEATKRITEDIIANIARNANSFIKDTIHDWEQEVEFGGEVSDDDVEVARRDYQELQEVLR